MSPVPGHYAQFYYQELTTPRIENQKIQHENKIVKENEPAPYV
jgi:hypothetical protein